MKLYKTSKNDTTSVSMEYPKDIYFLLKDNNLITYVNRYEQIWDDGQTHIYYRVVIKSSINYKPLINLYLYEKDNYYNFNGLFNQSEKTIKKYMHLAKFYRSYFNMEPLA